MRAVPARTARLRRGFKTDAERISLSIRAELRLAAADRLDCFQLAFQLAAHLGVLVVPLPDLLVDGARPESIAHLRADDAQFSAVTVCLGTRRLIVYNSDHPLGRCANSLAHELSHIIHDHPPAAALSEGGCREWHAVHEAEADWQAGALLVPRDGLLAWLRRGGSPESGAEHFGVSLTLFRWRLNQTGVARQLAVARRRR